MYIAEKIIAKHDGTNYFDADLNKYRSTLHKLCQTKCIDHNSNINHDIDGYCENDKYTFKDNSYINFKFEVNLNNFFYIIDAIAPNGEIIKSITY